MGYKTKLYLGFSVMLMTIVVFLGIAMVWIYHMHENMDEVIKDRYEKNRLASSIEQRFYMIDNDLKSLMLTTDREKQQGLLEDIERHQNEQRVSYQSYALLATHPRVLEQLPVLKNTMDNFEQLSKECILLLKSGSREQAVRLLQTSGQRLVGQAGAVSRELRVTQERMMLDILAESAATSKLGESVLALCMVISIGVGLAIVIKVIGTISGELKALAAVITQMRDTAAQTLPRLTITSRDEIGEIAAAFNEMAAAIERHRRQEKEITAALEEQNWLITQVAEMSTLLQGVSDLTVLGKAFISKLAPAVGASFGTVYLVDHHGEEPGLTKLASYADTAERVGKDYLALGEGLTGQCAAQNQPIILEKVPEGYLTLTSGLGNASPDYVAVFPASFSNKSKAVVEVAGFGRLTAIHRQYLQQVMNSLAVILIRVSGRVRVEQLLAESQAFAEELQSQSEELQQQQEELRITNEQLAEQYKQSEQKTLELEQAKAALEEQARQLDLASRYKSEFLANMSHELRTPLNSLLILAQMLAVNQEENLTSKQLEYVHAIHSAGSDLFMLINDILDLSKLESGKLHISSEPVVISELAEGLTGQFTPLAERTGLDFTIEIDQDVPAVIFTDLLRLQQILKNLLSNAFKFTEKGWVKVTVKRAANPDWLLFAVSDSGIGIAVDKQAMIFEAFRQADGTTSRKYGGTGLGLSISRELSKLLNGYINLESREDYGSTFTLYLPVKLAPDQLGEQVQTVLTEESVSLNQAAASVAEPAEPAIALVAPPAQTHGGEASLKGKKILIVDDDMRNVYALVAAMEAKAMTAFFAQNGREAIECLTSRPDMDLVIMDIMMPEMDGYQAIEAIRKIPAFSDLPIIVLSAKAMKSDRDRCLEAGASDYISKPVHLEQLFSLMRVWLYQ